MTEKSVLTGWCEGPNHYVCRQYYTGRGLVAEGKVPVYDEINYVCSCSCHDPRPVHKVQRRSEPHTIVEDNEKAWEESDNKVLKDNVRLVQRRPVKRIPRKP